MADNFPIPILPYLEGKIGELRIMRFWSKVDMRGPDECWDWKASTKGKSGYGRFKIASYQSVTASRFALISTSKTEPSGMHVLHSCDRPICCNPNHLRFGTPADNTRDKTERNRHSTGNQSGANNGHAKLTEQEFQTLVSMLKDGFNNKQIANQLPVSHAMVSKVRVGKAWVKQAQKLGWTAKKQFERRAA